MDGSDRSTSTRATILLVSPYVIWRRHFHFMFLCRPVCIWFWKSCFLHVLLLLIFPIKTTSLYGFIRVCFKVLSGHPVPSNLLKRQHYLFLRQIRFQEDAQKWTLFGGNLSEASWEFSPECVECKQQAGMNILLSGLYKYFSCDVSEQISPEIKLFAR